MRVHIIYCLVIFGMIRSVVSSGAAQSGQTNSDQFCSITNAPSPLYTSSILPESTRRIIQRVEQVTSTIDPMSVIYLSDRRAPIMAAMLDKITNRFEKVEWRLRLAITLTDAGQPEAALEQFKIIDEFIDSSGQAPPDQFRTSLRIRKAMALLRLGELENCLLNHNADSCLLPLRPPAFHQLTRGSRGAVTVLQEQLKDHPDDLVARWLINVAYMTLGEYPEKVPPSWLIPPKVFDSDYNLPRFTNIAGPLGLDLEGLAGGCILDDFDNDGFIDIVVSRWNIGGHIQYFHNDGNGRFTERTAQAGLLGMPGGLNIVQTDYNNDGLPDIWIERGAWWGVSGRIPSSLLRNNGDGTFTDVTEAAGLLSPHPSQAGVWFDYDGDGWLDLFKGNETTRDDDPDPSELFHNNHDGTFTECAASCGLKVKAFVKGVACADYDHDGRPDLYLSIMSGTNLLFHNDGLDASGHWKFTEVGARAGVTEPILSFPTWFFDYDNDGWEDIFVTGNIVQSVGDVAADYLGLPNKGNRPKLYRNNHDGTFTDVTKGAHLDRVLVTMGSNFGDLDNDGWLDFYLGTGDPSLATIIPKRMFRNAEGRFFQDVTTSGGFGHLQKGHGVAFADLANRGLQDVFIVLGGAYPGDRARSALFLNPGNSNHWITLKLEGTKANRVAIGARIKVTVATPKGPRSIYKTVNSGGSFGAQPLRQHIGLGNATAINQVEIVWPGSGSLQTLSGFELDHAYRIREDKSQPIAWPLKKIAYDLSEQHLSHMHAEN